MVFFSNRTQTVIFTRCTVIVIVVVVVVVVYGYRIVTDSVVIVAEL